MAKITGYGFWIYIKSLKGADKRNWITCLVTSGLAGGIAGWFSVSLSADNIETFGTILIATQIGMLKWQKLLVSDFG